MQHGHAAIVYNPVKVSLDRVKRGVRVEEDRGGWDETRWYPTDADDSGLGAAQRALRDDPAVIIVAAGDGVVRVVAEAMKESSTPLAIVPSGTGNLLARNLDLPLNDVEACLRIAFGDLSAGIDVAVAELEDDAGTRSTHRFLVMAGIGLDAEMAEKTSAQAKRRLGWLAYVTPIARSIIANRQFHLRYRVDAGHVRSGHAHTVIVGNCGTLTGNMLLLPAAEVDDGLLDVVMLSPGRRFGWARIGTRLTIQGVAHRSRIGRRMMQLAPDIRPLVYAQGRRFEVRFDAPHAVELDGDSFGPVRSARITVLPAALDIRVAADRAGLDRARVASGGDATTL
jgi:diacylglycerol kinase family enzyme